MCTYPEHLQHSKVTRPIRVRLYKEKAILNTGSVKYCTTSNISILYRGGQMFSDALTFSIESYSKQVMQNKFCGNKLHLIIQNMILSQGLELKLSLL